MEGSAVISVASCQLGGCSPRSAAGRPARGARRPAGQVAAPSILTAPRGSVAERSGSRPYRLRSTADLRCDSSPVTGGGRLSSIRPVTGG